MLRKIVSILISILMTPIFFMLQSNFANANIRSSEDDFDGKKVVIEFSDKNLFLERAALKNAAAFFGEKPRTQELYFDYNREKDAYKIYYADEPSLVLALDLYPYHEPNNVFFTNDGNSDEQFWKLERVSGSNKYYLRNYKGGGYLAGIGKFGGINVEVRYNNSNYYNNYTELTIHPRNDENRAYISVGGINYNGDKSIEGLKINIDYSKNNLFLTNRSNEQIHSGFSDNRYFKLRLLDKNNREKKFIELKGNDIPSSSKYDKLKFIKFEVGDLIELYHEEPFRLKIKGSILGSQVNNNFQLYQITEKGLKPINMPISQGVYNIRVKKNPEYFLIRSYSGFGVAVYNNVDSNNDSSKWEFIYDADKDAYIIKNMETNKVLVNKFYSYGYQNAVQAIDEPNDNSKYFKILKLENNEFSMINLETNLAITVNEYNSIGSPIPYSNLNNQKFILERK